MRGDFGNQTQNLDDATLDNLSEGINRGGTYEVTTERDLTLFVDLLGGQFLR